MEVRIGCSGFAYNDWSGLFYPDDLPRPEWLEYYAEHFDTLELNVSFYRTPGPIFFKNIYKRTPQDFCCIVKIPQSITHLNRMVGIQDELDKFYSVIREGLREKLGAVLFQFPGSFEFTPQRLASIIENLDPTFENVVEFRNATWWQADVERLLGLSGTCFCSVSYPGLPDKPVINTATTYYRFHGVPKLYYSIYATDFLRAVAETFMLDGGVKKTYFLFNNTATRAALENASYLQDYISL